MTSSFPAAHCRPPLVTLLVALACAQAGCSLGSLDYLQNGAKRDSGAVDGAGSVAPDAATSSDLQLDTIKPDAAAPDATASEAPLGPDGAKTEDAPTVVPLPDAKLEVSDGTSTDTLAPDAKSPDDAGADAPANLDVPKLDSPIADKSVAGPDSLIPDSPPDLPNADAPTAKLSVLFVVGANNPLSAADLAIQNHLISANYEVTAIRDNASTTVTQTVIVISRSISSGNVGTRYRTIAKPVMVNEYNLFDSEMGLVSGATGTAGSTGASPGADSLDVQAAAGELAAELSGTVKVFQAVQDVTYGVPNASAIPVAALTGQPTKLGCFAYETGSQMSGLTAPARRVGFFLSSTSAPSLSTSGWRLFDAAIAWLAKSK